MHKYSIIAVLMLISAHAFTQSVVVLDTTVNVLDPLVNCGEDSQVNMQGGIADYYQWYKNGQPLEGATQRNYIAQVSGT
jgi:hypothetical protein